jgi:hypothetical protein
MTNGPKKKTKDGSSKDAMYFLRIFFVSCDWRIGLSSTHRESSLRWDAKIEEIRHEIEILKANEKVQVYKLRIYRMAPQNIPQNLVRLSL